MGNDKNSSVTEPSSALWRSGRQGWMNYAPNSVAHEIDQKEAKLCSAEWDLRLQAGIFQEKEVCV
jgi:hypothetical protein